MAFPTETRFSSILPAENDMTFTTRTNLHNPYQQSSDARNSLQRRYTDSSKLGMNRMSFGSQFSGPNIASASQLEQKQIIEDIQIARRKAQEQLALLDEKERRLQMNTAARDSNDRFATNFNRMSLNGPVSEPTTPPEFADDAFSYRYSRTNRVSLSNITSPPGLSKRTSLNSKVTSPPTGRLSNSALYSTHRQSTKSMPGSRRGSDEEEEYIETLPVNKATATMNRFSMPVNGTRLSTVNTLRRNAPANISEVGPVYTDDALTNTYTALTGTDDDSFPILNRDGSRLSANLAATELINSTMPEDGDYIPISRPRPGHASMPHNDSSMYRPVLHSLGSSPPEKSSSKASRHSSALSFDYTSTGTIPVTRPGIPQTSFSSNDVPTVRRTATIDSMQSPPHSSHADAHFHAHNVSLGRIPQGGVLNRQSRDIGSFNPSNQSLSRQEDKTVQQNTNLQASVAPFSPGFTSTESQSSVVLSPIESFTAQTMYPFLENVQSYSSNQLTSPVQLNTPLTALPHAQSYGRQDVRAPNNKPRSDMSRLDNVPLSSCIGHLYSMSKDQHGCRYMQRQLECAAMPGASPGGSAAIDTIFIETSPHIAELMTDPFGNYLCQKLFEYCSDAQRSTLIMTASPYLPSIALNQHGTRALQKMIEYVNTPAQTDLLIASLANKVVDLVQDLNGNHVIQKCLHTFTPEKCQFIYDAVSGACVAVGTHRHGCCVLQRCIDHAQGYQRAELVAAITNCAFDLVQDAYGNYVVQYILDLDEPTYTRPLCQSFSGKIIPLSKQKFSSNVIEKCLRVADPQTKQMMTDEILQPVELERMLRDAYANYVVQTALDYADLATKARMIDLITPILPSIKSTPHGRRIASKIQTMKNAQSQQVNMTANVPDTSFNARMNNRRQIQINGGGFVFGGRGMPTQNFVEHDSFSALPQYPQQQLPMSNFGFGAQPAFNQAYPSQMGMGNYI